MQTSADSPVGSRGGELLAKYGVASDLECRLGMDDARVVAFQRRVEFSLAAITGREAWIGWGGEGLSLAFIDDVLVVHADEDHSAEIVPALNRIEEVGPEAVVRELGIAPDW